ncbi:sensor histidine kinase [Sphingobacterium faecium]|uniref:sensor histidine kinase n=1 Tax=Sphingobacterium faecium TaxID=34087 RepID=UPI00097E7D68|nr:hybrid sensor histidine kinase/response regulator [Sphingobacterium faecium]WGQ15644.1 hybrid sensor histidine kinase/response regulator [Sphingobacterium faecium]SJN52196.1 Two-component response regulator [Sphingobacterium faecium PCAi_F2.5]
MIKDIEILYIDDELNNLFGFKANFRYSYVVHTASSTIQAEEILIKNPNIRIIFCDQRMPNELGIDFFFRIKKEFPRPIRILLTAYADMETVIDAVNKGHIFRFVRKPWLEEEMISCIEEADKFYAANSMLDIKNEELEKAYHELDKFAYSVSHDLRDPLTGVLSAVKLALQFDDIDQIHELLRLMDGSLTRLDLYIDSLRDYYLLRRGELFLSSIDFKELFKDIAAFYNMYVRNNDVQFIINVDQAEDFKCDKTVLELILHNLLSNAFKYQRQDNEDKFVKLSVKVADGYATFVVSDCGIGISPEYINDIFKLFFRASDQAEGMGFGLYNVKSALMKLQGTVDVKSDIGVGTTFTIVVPSK